MPMKFLLTYYKLLKKFFDDDTTAVYASSLSFYTIFSIIPVLFLTLSIVTKIPGFGTEYAQLKAFIFANLMPASQETLGAYLDGFLANSFSLGVLGFVSILYASVMFFYNYDTIVRKIFNAPDRTFWNALTTYWSFLTLMPIAMIVSFYLSGQIQNFLDQYNETSWINLLFFLPFLIVWVTFFAVFKISPNTPVTDKAAFLSSLAFTVVWYTAKSLFVYYVVANKSYASIYGSFSTLLFFFLWIYFSWLFFLYALKLCHTLNSKHHT